MSVTFGFSKSMTRTKILILITPRKCAGIWTHFTKSLFYLPLKEPCNMFVYELQFYLKRKKYNPDNVALMKIEFQTS